MLNFRNFDRITQNEIKLKESTGRMLGDDGYNFCFYLKFDLKISKWIKSKIVILW